MLHEMEELNIGQNLSRARSLSSVEWLLILRFLEVAVVVQVSFWLKFPRILNLVIRLFGLFLDERP